MLSRKFDYGFRLEHHLKDVRLGNGLLGSSPAPMLRQAESMLQIALKEFGPDADHVEVVRILEDWIGEEIS